MLLLKLPVLGQAILLQNGNVWIKSHFRRKLAPNMLAAAWVAMIEHNEDIQQWMNRTG